jgi:hypothetical protein
MEVQNYGIVHGQAHQHAKQIELSAHAQQLIIIKQSDYNGGIMEIFDYGVVHGQAHQHADQIEFTAHAQ